MVTVEPRLESDGQDLHQLLSKESNVYFDVKVVTLAPESFWAVGRLFWEQAKRYDATAVGGDWPPVRSPSRWRPSTTRPSKAAQLLRSSV